MVSGAALLSESLAQLHHVSLGYTADHLAFFAVAIPQEMFDSEPKFWRWAMKSSRASARFQG
jgi:hypothetical protein